MRFSQKTSTFFKPLKALWEVEAMLLLFLNAVAWQRTSFFQRVFGFLEAFMRNVYALLSKEKDALQTRQRSTFFTHLKALLEVKAVMHLFRNAVVWQIICSVQSAFGFLEDFVRNARAFLSKDKHSHHILRPMVKSERSVPFVPKYCCLKNNHSFL